MSTQPFIQFYVADYMADTRHLTTEQHGAYLLILMTMWKAGATLPNDAKKLARIAGVTPRRWHLIWCDLAPFFTVEGDTITQKRLLRDYQEVAQKLAKRSAAGSLGGKAKALNEKEARLASASVLPCHSSEPEPEPEKEEEQIGADAPVCVPQPPSVKAPPKASLPANWIPCPEDVQRAEACGVPPHMVSEVVDEFRSYWSDRRDAKARKSATGWRAAWRNWCERAGPQKRRAYGGGGTHSHGAGQSGGRTSLAAVVARRQMQREADALSGDAGWGGSAAGDDGFDPFAGGDVVAFAPRRGC